MKTISNAEVCFLRNLLDTLLTGTYGARDLEDLRDTIEDCLRMVEAIQNKEDIELECFRLEQETDSE